MIGACFTSKNLGTGDTIGVMAINLDTTANSTGQTFGLYVSNANTTTTGYNRAIYSDHGDMQINDGGLCVGLAADSGGAGSCYLASDYTDGVIYSDLNSVTAIDLAEIYLSTDKVVPSKLVMLDLKNPSYVKMYDPHTVETEGSKIVGIVSTKPGVLLGDRRDEFEIAGTFKTQVALVGRVPVSVTDENGALKPGDMITGSRTRPGYGMKADDSSTDIIGLVLRPLEEGKVEVMLNINLANISPVKREIAGLKQENTILKDQLMDVVNRLKVLKDNMKPPHKSKH